MAGGDGRAEEGELRIGGAWRSDRGLDPGLSERIRYGLKKNGYHGGISPQEMVVPIAVLYAGESYPVG